MQPEPIPVENMKTRALRALVGVGLSLDPEGKEKGSWWHWTSDFVLIAPDAVVLLIVALVAADTNAHNTKLGHYSTAVSIRSEARMTRGWSTSTVSNREAASPLSRAVSDKFGTKNLKSHLPAVFSKFMTPTLKLDIKF